MKQYQAYRADMIRLFDEAYNKKGVVKAEQKKLRYLITEISYELIGDFGHKYLKAIFDKYNDTKYDEAETKANENVAEIMKNMATAFGIELHYKEEINTPEQFAGYMKAKM